MGPQPALGIDLCWYHGTLRFYDPVNREYLPELIEAMAQRDEEAQARAAAEARTQTEIEARAAAEARTQTEIEGRAAAEAELQRLRDLLRRRPAE